ncbi:probable L-gulonolactone oxidase 6 [Quercus robur]|uniref:probable L-gulonolactone oxidase 6 n=1 Tax=Quercus robur TaxID=38942 RepID=UPI002161CB85|nr:probable L-gulonolactone oxidase 6 [Quercus robur]
MVLLRSKTTSVFLLIFVACYSCSPPEEPIKCSSENTNCTITNSYGAFPDRSTCRAAEVAYPTTEQELISIMAEATKNRRKMKVATCFSHSIPKLVCPDGQEGLLISTKYLNHMLKIDVEAMTMTIESGVTLRQLINEAAKAGLALPYTPYWWGLTIGGLLSTGAHGSTLWANGSSVHDYLLELQIVSPGGAEDGYVKVRRLKDGDKDFNAAKVSLGVLGVISQVTLKLQPLFKRSIIYLTKNDSNLGDQVASFGHQHEFADIIWYPSQRKAVYRIDDRVSTNTSGNGLYNSISFRPIPSLELGSIRTLEELLEHLSYANGKCASAKKITSKLLNTAYGLSNNDDHFTGYPVVGFHNRLQASGTCLDSHHNSACAWDRRVNGAFFHQTTFSISLFLAKSFIQDVQKLIEMEPKAMCGVELYNGILMRYVKASSAYLGKQEDAVDFDITYYRSKNPMTPRLYEDILEEVEQLALFKYGALPHWGKNRNLAFDGTINKYKNAREFLKVKEVYDPFGLFSSAWTDQILGLKNGVTIAKEGCALEGLCICSEDIHCAPKKGYYCRLGKVYKDAKVCTRITSKINICDVS